MKYSKNSLMLLAILVVATQFSYGQCAPDIVGPVVVCPPEANFSCIDDVPDGATSFDELVALNGNASDDCSDQENLSIAPSDEAVGTCPTIITRTYTITDEAGNSTTCSHVITVLDDTAPEVTNCLADTIVYVDATCESNVSLTAPSYSDNCGVASAEYRVLSSIDTTAAVAFTSGEIIDLSLLLDEYEVRFVVVDECMNSDSCSTFISSVDTILPQLVIPPDFTVTLEPMQCDTLIALDGGFSVSDNCLLSQVGDFGLDGLTQVSGVAFDEPYTVGVFENIYMLCDSASNCVLDTFYLTVEEFEPDAFGSLTEFNLSIDESCEGNITPDMVLIGTEFGCLENCTVVVMDEDGNELPNQFDGSHIGQSFMYAVSCNGNTSMGIVNIEDKFPPQIECSPDTVTVAEILNYPTPMIIENCSGAVPELVNETLQMVDCADPEIESLVVRTYRAIDAAGNESDLCEQVLSIQKFDMGTIEAPATQNFDIDCSDDYPTDANGAPDPEFYGGPTLGGMDIFPDNFIEFNLFASFTDEIIQTSLTDISILRVYEVTRWQCGGDSTRTFAQIFNISDSSGPEFDCPEDMTFTTEGIECTADIILPQLIVNDACSNVAFVTVQYEGGFIDGNGGLANLPNGMSTVTYTAEDTEGNVNSCSFDVLVSDSEQPIAVCEQFTTITLTNQGNAIVNASSFDDGSFDPCGDVTIEVRRMNATCEPTDVVFGENVTFCCDDIGVEHMVVLRITDESGNFNECMVMAEVQDKVPPVLVQGLPDITVSCEFPFNEDDLEQFGSIQFNVDDIEDILLTAELVQFNGPSTDGLVLGNCIDLVSDEFISSDFNSCGIGSAIRTLTFANSEGLTVSDQQLITFVNPSPFTLADIDFPNNLFYQNVCDISTLQPAFLPPNFNFPVITEDGCDQVGFDFEDSVTDYSDGAQTCYEITRTWTVIDWCQSENGVFQTFEGTQIITVVDTQAPTITGDCSNREVNSLDPDCGPIFIELINSATDVGCPNVDQFLNFTYTIDAFSDGTIDVIGETNNASGSYPVGTHTISWVVADGCGNEDDCSYTFTLNNTKLPSPKCLDNLTGDLTPVDTDGDNIADDEQITVTPEMFDAGSDDPCGTPVLLSFSSDVNDVERTYDCNDIGENLIELWVTDENGNQDFCITSFVVEDNNGVDLCVPEPLMVDVIGELKTESNEMIALGSVALEGGNVTDVTEDDGQYDFADMPTGGDYIINPVKNIDHTNGISVADMILIQKHILGLSPLNSPYKILAADVNNSQNVTGADIIQIRKLLLGYYNEFPQNTSWRFIDGEHTFIDPANPWMSDIPETYEIFNLQENMVADFNGYKVGDVNNSATPNQLIGDQIDTRSDEKLFLEIDDARLSSGESSWVEVRATDMEMIIGLQVGIAYAQSDLSIIEIRSAELEIDESNFRIDKQEGTMKFIWTSNQPVENHSNVVLFEMLVEANTDTRINQALRLDDKVLRNESYDTNLDITGLELKSSIVDIEEDNVITEMTVSQNEPNPWNASTSINIVSTVTSSGTMRIMDVNGKVVYSRNVEIVQGENVLVLNREELSSAGLLYYEIEIGETRFLKKMIVIE